jgi:serine/threonine-protein kinase
MQTLGKYEIVEKIGVGGFGVVYRGFDPFIKRPVAIKTCSAEDTETRERFRREAEIAGNLQHRNIVTVFEFGFQEETPYLVEELLSGEDLDRKIKRHEFVPLPEKILWLVQIARGLAFAHERGIVHRDIKPGNVRILDDGTAKILDFGIAKLAHQASNLTQAGMTLGTAAYLAPEQIRGQPVDSRTDVFSFGVLAFELLAFERPFRAAEISAIFYKILHESPPSLAANVPDVPVDLDRIVARCLAKDPARRWSPSSQLVLALEGLMQRRPGAATVDTTRTRIAARVAEAPTAPVPARPAPERQNLDDLEFHHAEGSPRVHSRSMATTAFGVGRPKSWARWAAAAGLVAAAIGVGAVWLGTAGRLARVGLETDPEPPARAVAAVPAAGAPQRPDPAPNAGPAKTPEAPAPPGAAPTPTPVEAPAPPPPEPAHLVVGPAWDPAIEVRVAGRRLRLDRTHRLELPAGGYTLAFSLETPSYSFRSETRVRLAEGETERAAIPIERPGRLTVQPHLNTPAGIVRLDGKMAGPAPLRGRWLAPGEHRVEVFPATGVTAEPALSRVVTVRSAVETVLTFDLGGAQETQVRERPSPAG